MTWPPDVRFRRTRGPIGRKETDIYNVEMIPSLLDRIGRFDGEISSIRCVDRRVTTDLDRISTGGSSQSTPLRGVPILVKDNIDIAGLPTTSGCVGLAAAFPKRDAAVVSKLKAAGAVIIGKTNLSEFSFEIRSRSSIGGDVRNPFNRDVTAGGSSGGAAAAVAAGFAPAAIGTDTGGSIRTPAAYNGLVGFRPTWDTIDRAGVAPLAPSTDTVGTLTHTVSDAAILLAVLTDTVAPLPERPGHQPERPTLRLGVLRQAFGSDGEIVEALDRTLRDLTDAGAVVIDPVRLPDDLLPIGRPHVVDWEFGPAFDHYLRTNFEPGAPASLGAILESGAFLEDYSETLRARAAVRSLDHAIYKGVLAFHARLRDGIGAVFVSNQLDALVYPTSAVVPTSLDNPRGGWAPELAACSGRPAVSLPVAQARNGIPIGLELLGAPDGDWELLRLAAAVERAVGRRFTPDLGALAERRSVPTTANPARRG